MPNEEGEVSSNPSSVDKKSLATIRSAPTWDLHIDGSSNGSGCGADLVFSSHKLERLRIEYALQLGFKASNNEVEYKAFLTGFGLAYMVGVKHFRIFSDSQLVARQVSGQGREDGKKPIE